MNDVVNKNTKSKKLIIIFIILLIIIFVIFIKNKNIFLKEKPIDNQYSIYRLSGNSLEKFDLYFLQLENEEKNKIYSPLSIKYSLGILNDISKGKTKKQISNIIGNYNPKKYVNSENMSLANALFLKPSFASKLNKNYTKILKKYNAEIVYDNLTSDTLNTWISKKTFKLINNISDDISDEDFILVNALAIDMEWVNKIQDEYDDYLINYAHENYYKRVSSLDAIGYHNLNFNNKNVKSVEIGAVINKYDIVNTLSETKIRETVGTEYQKWLDNGTPNACGNDILSLDDYLDKYIDEINKNYEQISSSTDFYYYIDDNVKVFAKDLKEYNGTTLQYIGIMPNNLKDYINNIDETSINTLINNLKSIELNNFKNGVITEITGFIPMFKFDYELNLIDDLNKLGITDVFKSDKANLSNLLKGNSFINQALHKTNIEFSNDGIKAASVITMGGKGASGCGFDYSYDVPVEKIDLTFDNPFLFLIRDKSSNEIWFIGTVYEPIEY